MTETKVEGGVLLAEGLLSWPRGERVTDRYGLVTIQERGYEEWLAHGETERYMIEPEARDYSPLTEAQEHAGRPGRLVAEIVATRESGHIGDLFHGFSPETPAVGELVELGRGELFREIAFDDVFGVGVSPTEALGAREFEGQRIGPDLFWMNPRRLYRCHEQTVRLWFVGERR